MKLSFTLFVIPRTKKTSNIVPVAQIMKTGLGRVLPSPAFTEMFKAAKPHIRKIRSDFIKQGIEMPVMAPVTIEAHFYREKNSGDWSGFTQALGDILQWKDSVGPQCVNCGCMAKDHIKRFCPTGRAGGYRRPPGVKNSITYHGLIGDDRQIQHWDGTRLHVDRDRPRIEVKIEILPAPELAQMSFEDDDGPEDGINGN